MRASLTYVRLPTMFVYLACLLDAFSCTCVGWNPATHLDSSLTIGTLDMALPTRDIGPGLIHHSDRGIPYVCHEYVNRLRYIDARIRMSARGNLYDNAQAESFSRQ